MLLKNRNLIILIVLLFQCVSSIYTQTIDDIVGNIPSEQSTIEEIANIYGVDMLPGARSFVSSIAASADSSGEYITVSWNGVVDSEITYYVYRSMEPALNSTILDRAKLISSINSSDSYSTLYSINDVLDREGSYYYAVVAEVNNVAKFYTATPGVDMTITPVLVNEIKSSFSDIDADLDPNVDLDPNADFYPSVDLDPVGNVEYVTSITASIKSSSESMVYWGDIPGYNGLYVIYKNSIPIENSKILAESVAIGRTPDVFFSDTNITSTYGPPYYYVVLENSFENPVFKPNDNYTTQELVLIEEGKEKNVVILEDGSLLIPGGADDDETTEVIRALVTGLTASREDQNVRLSWSITNNLPATYHYILISSTNEFDTNVNIMNNAAVIGITKLSDTNIYISNNSHTYLDTPIPNLHMYNPIYYALALIQNNEIPIIYTSDGMYTKTPIIINKPQEKPITEDILDNVVAVDRNNTLIVMPLENEESEVLSSSSDYDTQDIYNKSVILFKERKYSETSKLLELIKNDQVNSKFNYQINLLLGRSYYKIGKKKNALDTFRSVYYFSPSEIDFWIAQVLIDL